RLRSRPSCENLQKTGCSAACSDAELSHDNYAALRAQMICIRKENGDKMGVIPTHLVVPAELEAKARQVVKNETRILTVETGNPPVPQSVPISNEWAGTAEMIMTPWL
ncbi:MAG: Mu-like prophage major head subunit gpT family protein, partial [Rhodospirillaceae bacterium]